MITTTPNSIAYSQETPLPLYKETKFQTTPDGNIPKDWKNTELGEVAAEMLGGGTPSTAFKEYWNGNIAWMTSAHINGMVVTKGQKYITKEGLEKSATHLVPKDNLLVATRVGIGKVAINQIDIAISQDLTGVIIDKTKADPAFLYWAILSNKQKLKALAQGSTIKGILRDDLGKLKLPMPPNVAEQRAIVGVLGVVDCAIELADRIIAQTERLKRGLMQQLLTRGIGHTETKQTPIGTIPKEWQVVKLKDAVKIDQESRDPSREMPNKTFTYIDIESIEGGTGKIRSPKIILGKDAPSRARRVVHENDVIMSTVRPYLKAFAIVPKEYDDVICSTGFAVLTSGNSVLPRFLLNVLFSNQTINQCNKMMVGGQYPALNQSQVSEIEISLPPLHEQQHISGILSTVDDKLELERAEKIRFERIKRGLMDLLLTGKIRIKVD